MDHDVPGEGKVFNPSQISQVVAARRHGVPSDVT